jgi:predicted nucleic acid-binding protein
VLVVADASPIILLSRVGRLELLPALFGRVLVPKPVFIEVVRAGDHRAGSHELDGARWLDLADVDLSSPLLVALCTNLDLGEAAAIALASERDAHLVLMDDREGRRVAVNLGLAVKGTLGVLIAAKQKGLVQEVRPLITALTQQGAWLSPVLKRQVLVAAGEDSTSDL